MKSRILLSLVISVALTSPAFACPAHHGKGAAKSDAKACDSAKTTAKDAAASDAAKTTAPAK